MSLICFFFGHHYGKWIVSMSGGYEKRYCTRCNHIEMRGRGEQ